MKALRDLLFLALILLSALDCIGQTTWTGFVDSDWSKAANWSLGVPATGDTAIIPATSNNPEISTSGAVAKSITIQSGATLTINSGATVSIDGNADVCLRVYGSVANFGNIQIGNAITSASQLGIVNYGTFTNNAGASIVIDRTQKCGIQNNSGSFSNSGSINIGSNSTFLFTGIENNSTFNHSSDTIIINKALLSGITINSSGVFTNNSGIKMGFQGTPMSILINGTGTFNNSTNGLIWGSGQVNISIFQHQGGTINPGGGYGIITFSGKGKLNTSTVKIDVKGKNTPGMDFDQVNFTDTLTAGGTLALNINYPSPSIGDELTILACNKGVKDSFDVITGLQPDWNIIYKTTGVVLRYGNITETVWIGDSSTVWSDPDNWSDGIPGATTDVMIQDTSVFYPVLTGNGLAKSISIIPGGTLTVAAGGILDIEGSTAQAINNAGIVTNSGTINIGSQISPGVIGINNTGTFENQSGGVINLDRSNFFGILNAAGTFTNSAQINIGRVSGPGQNGIRNSAIFNNLGGEIIVDKTVDGAIFNDTLSNFENTGTLKLGGNDTLGHFGIVNKYNFNNTGGTIEIDRTRDYAFSQSFGTFNNTGDIEIGAQFSVGKYGLSVAGNFNNNSGGNITINRASQAAIVLSNTAVFQNNSTIAIGELSVINDMIYGTLGQFLNSAGGTLKGIGNIVASAYINNGGTLKPGSPTGIINFTGTENFGNCILEMDINGNGSPGVDYDRVSISDAATLGGTLVLNVPYGGAPGDQIQLISAANITGTFSSVSGVPPGWTLDYSANAVTLTYITAGGTTWTGSIDSDWNKADNWSDGLPLTTSDVTIPDVSTHDPVIATTISIKSLTLNTGALLTINATGTLNIDGALAQALLNNGNISNSGVLNIGATGSVGSNGLKNNGTFTNNSAAIVNINRTINSALENSGVFDNGGAINIGNVDQPGANGILNTSTFNNLVSGSIYIDRTGYASVYNNTGGTFNHQGSLDIGPSGDLGEVGILNIATFNLISGSQIIVNSCTETGIDNRGTMTNSTTVNIGNINFPGYDGLNNTGQFTNSAGAALIVGKASDYGVWNDAGGSFTNQGSIQTGNASLPGQYGVRNDGTFINSGPISIDYVTTYGLRNNLGTFNNNSTITLGNSGSSGDYGVYNNGIFNNNTSATINIDRNNQSGIYNYANGTLNNYSTINIGSNNAVGIYGIYNIANFNNNSGSININNCSNSGIFNDNKVFTNEATINIGSISSVGQYGIRNRNIFFNSDGQININRVSNAGFYSEAGTFSNSANVVIGQLVSVADLIKGVSGSFDNLTGGVLSGTGNINPIFFDNAGGKLAPGYSPGSVTFTDNTSLDNGIIAVDVDGKNTPGVDFDQIVVNGDLTIGGTLEISNHFLGAVMGDQVTVITANSLTGTFANIVGLQSNWSVTYTSTGVVLHLGPFLPIRIMEFKAAWENDQALLNWLAISDNSSSGFVVERSFDTKIWIDAGFVPVSDHIGKPDTYSFVDHPPASASTGFSERIYYRLRLIDKSGMAAFSKIQSITAYLNKASILNSVVLYPNPFFNDNLTIEFAEIPTIPLKIELFDLEGNIKDTWNITEIKQRLNFDDLVPGSYMLRISDGENYVVRKIVKI